MSPKCLPPNFGSIWLTLWEQMRLEGFQDCPLVNVTAFRWEQNGFCYSESLCGPNASHQVWAQSDVEFGSKCGFKIFKLQPSWTAKWNNFSNSESLCCSYASHQVSAQSNLGLGGDVVWRISRWLPRWTSWTSEWNDFSNSESLCHSDASH